MARICHEGGPRVRTNVMTSTLARLTTWMAGDWKSSLADSPCGGAMQHNRMALFWRKHGERWSVSVQSWPATGDVHVSWWSQCWDGSLLRPTSFNEVLCPRKSAACLTFSKATAAWLRRWRSMLGLSLLGRVPLGADGEVPMCWVGTGMGDLVVVALTVDLPTPTPTTTTTTTTTTTENGRNLEKKKQKFGLSRTWPK